VFVDGDHRHQQVLRDIENSLKALNKNGSIVLHDYNHQGITPFGAPCTVWRAWLVYRMTRADLSMTAIDTVDGGCGIIRFGKQELFPGFEFFQKHRRSILHPISIKELL
jgi:hypothetical protein